jgi:predicted ATPase/class 3 adenylate cyclase
VVRPGDTLTVPARPELPSGTVTFVFTDIEGSTRLAHDLGTQRWGEVLAQHASIVRAAASAHEGVIVRNEGDSFFLAFRSARQAVAAAADAERAFIRQPWAHGATVKVRIGMHTGENARPGTTEDAADYVGYDVHRAARVSSAAHGGQVLISSSTRTLLGDQLPPGVTLRDLGEHRLKDMSQPDRLYQVVIDGVPDAFPALRTLERAPNNLPVQLTSFIGRRRELADARALLDRTHLLTLVGPGGTGKSRLSLELAAQVMDTFPDGVWFVRLAAVTDPALVASTIAHTIGLVVPPARKPLEHLVDQFRDKKILLVIDNFEQVVAAAPDIGAILRECSGVKAIVTTRIVLRLAGEQEYPVPPLALPDPNDVPDVAELSRSDAIQLFVERARAARPEFALTNENSRAVVGIVAQLDGLPLAIELAAARVKILPPQAILERLASGLGILQSSARDLPARQRTLRGAIAWSFDLLDPGLRRLFQRLSVFRGGAALAEIEAVCGPADEIGRDVLDGVADLVDQSLLRRIESGDDPRFLMLETIREFAREKLEESGEGRPVELRHAQAFVALAESIAPRLYGAEQKALLDRLELEVGNMRAAIDDCSLSSCVDRSRCSCAPEDHVADDERVAAALRLASALWRFWQMRGHLQEGRERTQRTLALPGSDRDRVLYMRALEAAGGVTYWLGELEATEDLYKRRLAVARELGDEVAVANALYDLSFTYLVPNRDIDRGEAMLNEALAIFRKHGDRGGIGKTLWALAGVSGQNGRYDRAAEISAEVIPIFREQGNRFGLAWALHLAGIAAERLGRFDESRTLLTEGMELFVEADDVSGIVLFLFDFGELAAAEGETQRALRLYGAMSALRDATGSQLSNTWELENVDAGRVLRGLLERTDPALRERLIAEGRAPSKEAAIAFALSERDAP